MRDSEVQMVETLTLLFVRTPLMMWLFRADERRLSEAQLERAWHPATRDLSTVLLPELAPVIHAVKTRGWLVGVPLGLLCTAVIMGGGIAVLSAEEWLLLDP